MSGSDEETGGEKPCFGHEVVGGHVVDAQTKADVLRFRKGERARLYALRRAMAQAELVRQGQTVAEVLADILGSVGGTTIAAYWPIRSELDLRPMLTRLREAGAQVALPVVMQKGQPVEFQLWEAGARMTRGIWNIPVPADARPVIPDVVVAPLLGVDEEGYRLGNGGGYYDMTLAALAKPPRVIGVGQDFCPMKTIFPQPWDVGMDDVILGDGTHRTIKRP